MIPVMSSILYPVANDAAAALAGPAGRAVRQREAEQIAGEAVSFVTDTVGPPYATREAALEACRGRVEDDRPGFMVQIPPEDRYARLVEVVTGGRPPPPATPVLKDGRRWPAPPPAPKTVWRLQVTYWRPVSAAPVIDDVQARKARVQARETLDPQTLRALTRQPLRAVRPQQPLDIGLFERRLPESPHIVVPDE